MWFTLLLSCIIIAIICLMRHFYVVHFTTKLYNYCYYLLSEAFLCGLLY